MRYRNNKTGAIIDSPFTVFGEHWELIKKEAAKETEEQEETEEEYVEEEVDLEGMTNKELEEFAEEQGIKLTTDDKKNKDARIAAIVAAFE
jgi:hypothetical protein